MEVTFANPSYLLFMASVPLLIISHFFTLRYLERRAIRFANFEAIRRVTGGDRASIKNSIILSRNLPILIMRVTSLIMLILAAAGTTLWLKGEVSSFSYVIAIDASSSMLADDFQPNRLAAAKSAAISFIDALNGTTKIGVITFSGVSFIEQEPTFDKDLVVKAIEQIKIKNVGGTDIGSSIITGSNLLLAEDKAKAVIILTDGRSNVGMDIDEGIKYALENNVIVHTIGVGTLEGGSFLKTSEVSTLDEESLQKISQATEGEYFRAENPEKLVQSFSKIASFKRELYPVHLSGGLLLLSIAILFTEWGLITTKFRTIP